MMKPLWQFGIPLIGGRELTLKQLDDVCKDVFLEPIIKQVTRTPDIVHILQRELLDAQGNWLPPPKRPNLFERLWQAWRISEGVYDST